MSNGRPFKLKHKRINNPVQMWIWRDGAFVPIVDAAIFEQARRIIESRHHHLSDQDLLERLRELLRLRGRLVMVLGFFITGLLISSASSASITWELKASRRRPDFSSHLFSTIDTPSLQGLL
jgi:hypothetical protein